MAKESKVPGDTPRPPTETVEVPVSVLARLEALEQAERARQELAQDPHALVLDRGHEAWKREAARPASERTQDLADRTYGTDAPRFRVRLDSSGEGGKPGPRVDEHFPLVLSAHSDLEACARYQQVMGISRHDYRIIAEPAAG